MLIVLTDTTSTDHTLFVETGQVSSMKLQPLDRTTVYTHIESVYCISELQAMNIMTVHVFILSLMRAKERPLQSI